MDNTFDYEEKDYAGVHKGKANYQTFIFGISLNVKSFYGNVINKSFDLDFIMGQYLIHKTDNIFELKTKPTIILNFGIPNVL